jgi:hypothetical protein
MSDSISVSLIKRIVGGDEFYVRVLNDSSEVKLNDTDKYASQTAQHGTIIRDVKELKTILRTISVVNITCDNDSSENF